MGSLRSAIIEIIKEAKKKPKDFKMPNPGEYQKVPEESFTKLMDILGKHEQERAAKAITSGTVEGIHIGQRYRFTDKAVNSHGGYMGQGLKPDYFYPGDEIVVTGIHIKPNTHKPGSVWHKTYVAWADVYYLGGGMSRHVSIPANMLTQALEASPGPKTIADTYDKRQSKQIEDKIDDKREPSSGKTIH